MQENTVDAITWPEFLIGILWRKAAPFITERRWHLG